jgi:hypothetical protein
VAEGVAAPPVAPAAAVPAAPEVAPATPDPVVDEEP